MKKKIKKMLQFKKFSLNKIFVDISEEHEDSDRI